MDNFSIGYSVDDSQLINKVGEDAKIVKQLDNAVQSASSSMKQFDKAQEGTITTIVGAKKELASLKKTISDLTVTYQAMSEAERKSALGKGIEKKLEELKRKAAQFTDAISDANEEIGHLASDTQFTDGMNLMVGTIGNVASAVVALSGDSEHLKEVLADLAKIQATVRAVESLTKAFQKQNLVLLKNPYVMAATAVAALGVAIYKIVKAHNDEEKALNNIVPAAENVAKAYDKISKSIDKVISLQKRMRSESVSSAESTLTDDRIGFGEADKRWRNIKKQREEQERLVKVLKEARNTTNHGTTWIVDGRAYDLRQLQKYVDKLRELKEEERAALKVRNEYANSIQDDRKVLKAAKERQAKEDAKKTKKTEKTTELPRYDFKDINPFNFNDTNIYSGYAEQERQLEERIKKATEKFGEQSWVVETLRDQLSKLKSEVLGVDEFQKNLTKTVSDNTLEFAKQEKEAKEYYEELASSVNVYDGIYSMADAFTSLGSAIDGTSGKLLGFAGTMISETAGMLQQMSQIIVANQAAAMAKGISSASGLMFPYNLAAIATVVATIASMFASLPKFASGGVVGSSSLGDMNLARVNGGEMILNGHQQENLFNLLNMGGTQTSSVPNGRVEFDVKGQRLVGVLENYKRKKSRV